MVKWKKLNKKVAGVLLGVMVLFSASTTAFAYVDPSAETANTEAAQTETVQNKETEKPADEGVLPENNKTEKKEDAFTEPGNGEVQDDIQNGSSKEFLTITTKNNNTLKTLVLETIKRTCDYAVENEAEFREKVCSISEEQQGELSVRLEKRLAKKQKRVSEINRLIRKLYEDNISGKLNDKRFNAMLSDYELELEALEADIDRDNAELEGMSAKKTDVDVFMELVKKHTTFEELTPAILNEFVDKIMVYKAVGSGANRTQDVDIYLNYIGRFVVPEVVVELTEEEKLAEAKRQEKLEKKRASNRKYMARKREEARKAWAEIEAEKAKAVGQ